MLRIKTELRPSEIHGIGLFAIEPVRMGQLIAQVDEPYDQVFRDGLEWFDDRFRELVRRFGYCRKSDGLWVLLCDDLRFMNHSTEPNTIQVGDSDYALCDVKAGDELTCNYYTFCKDAAWALR